ncbi:C-type lectin-like isoform X2 [Hypomesus transpacificus]|nr:C-type lectin-like isoform X2 [Hypomesus transpacificus]
MTWTEAKSYCREHYTDLARVRCQTENQQISNIKPADVNAWIGLYRDPWKWSDGSKSTFRYWRITEPNNNLGNEFCVASEFADAGIWADWPCNWTFPFFCNIPRVQQQVVRMSLTRENSGVDLEDPAVKEAILQQVQVKLREKGLTEAFQLRWRKQPDGKVFHKEEEESSQRKRKKRERKPVLTKKEL